MTMLNVRLDEELAERLEALIEASGRTRSEIVRQAIGAYVPSLDVIEQEMTEDDWSDFHAEVVETQSKLLKSAFEDALEKVLESEWMESVEPLYDILKRKAVEKTKKYGLPWIQHYGSGDVSEGEINVVAGISFALDDDFRVSISLEDLFFDAYHEYRGAEVFNQIPSIWQRARARIDAGEPQKNRS